MRIEALKDLLRQFPDPSGLWNFRNLSETEQNFRSLFPAHENWSESDVLNFHQYIRVLDLQGKHEESKLALEESKKKWDSMENKNSQKIEISFLIEQGRHFCLLMVPSQAQKYFFNAWEMSLETKQTPYAIEAALLLSINQPLKQKREWLERALELAEKSNDPIAQLWLGPLLMMEGWRCYDLHRYEEATVNFEKAFKLPAIQEEEPDKAVIRWSLARSYRASGKFDDSLSIQRKLEHEMNLSGKPNGHVLLEIAECLQSTNEKDEAKEYFKSAYKELSLNDWYTHNRPSELQRIKFLANIK